MHSALQPGTSNQPIAGQTTYLGTRIPYCRAGQPSPRLLMAASGAAEKASRLIVDPLTGDDPAEVGRYRLHARLGAGGMGTVYLALTPGGRPVALKMVRPELADNADFRARFRQEVDAARRVHGLYTAQVLDADPDGDPPWLVTAFVPGLTLQEGVRRHGPLPVDTVLILMAGVAEALEMIHAAGVVHRDLKPSNVLLAPDGPRVIDFGIARAAETSPLTGSGIRIGSPHYMAPEQVADKPVSPAADVFALGSLATFAVLGRSPFGEGDALPVMYRVLHQPADLSGCPSPVRAIIERCLANNPAERPTAAEVISLCRAVTAGRTRQIAQPWLQPAVAAVGGHAADAAPAADGLSAERLAAAVGPAAAVVGPAAAGPAAGDGVPAGVMTRHQPPQPSVWTAPAPAINGRPPKRRRHRLRAAVLTLSLAAVCLVALLVAAGAWLISGSNSAGPPSGRHSPGSPASASPPASWLTGTWIGAANQPTGVVTHWTAELTFPRSGRVGTFRFPSLGCSGTLIVTRSTRTTASVDEELTQNPRQVCVARGLMQLTRSGTNGMTMTWQDASNRSNVATGYLKPR